MEHTSQPFVKSPARTFEKNTYEVSEIRTNGTSFGGHIALPTTPLSQHIERLRLSGGVVAVLFVVQLFASASPGPRPPCDLSRSLIPPRRKGKY